MQPKASRSDVPQPAALILERQNELVTGYENAKALDRPVYTPPHVLPKVAHEAAMAWARWDTGDPFSYGRIYNHIMRGYLLASDVASEAKIKLDARVANAIDLRERQR